QSPRRFSSYALASLPELHSFPTRRSSDLPVAMGRPYPHRSFGGVNELMPIMRMRPDDEAALMPNRVGADQNAVVGRRLRFSSLADRKSTRLNSSHEWISYAVFCLKKKK